ncbi:MAG TPA: MarR family winged helix-turn-helix transcriptional regulator [Candidatus Dormibacteraeota bacterium]
MSAEVQRLHLAVSRRFHARRQRLPGSDVTPRMLGLLRHLAGAGPLTIGAQARHLDLTPATVTALVDRLEARRLVERVRDERDRRRVFVWLTSEGRRRATTHPEVLEGGLLGSALARMTPADRATLVTGLRALLDAASAVEATAPRLDAGAGEG